MMENHEFCDNCPGCRPALLDVNTGQKLADDSSEMQIVNRVWDNDTTYAQRRAFIEVTLHNSRVAGELQLAQEVFDKIGAALGE